MQVEIASVAAMTRALSAKGFLIAAKVMARAVAWSLAFVSTAHLFAERNVEVRLNRLHRRLRPGAPVAARAATYASSFARSISVSRFSSA